MSIGRKREQFSILKISWPKSRAGDLKSEILFGVAGWRALRNDFRERSWAWSRAEERKWLQQIANYQKRQGVVRTNAVEEILKEIVMKQWLNQRDAVENFGANFRENDNSLSGFMDKGKG